MKTKIFAYLFAFLFTGFANASLITNGDFATGDISGWNLTGGEWSQVESGVFREYDNSGWAVLSQDITTNTGQAYDLSFDTFASFIQGNDFAWTVDGVLNSIATTTEWVTNTGSFSATDTTTNVAFYMATDPGTGTWRLDNVSVTAVAEPSALILLAFGLLMLAYSRKRKAL